MILRCDAAATPAEQMARDAAWLAAAGDDPAFEPVLRVYRFVPQGITLGYSQRPERELDLARCAADGVPWAVRPTGGRAIFHAEEWTYALAARLDDPDWGGSLSRAYGAISMLLVAALRRLGVPALQAPRVRRGAVGAARSGDAGVAAPCFASTSRHEIVAGGRKLVGSAQRRTQSALLQQGSVLLGPGHARLADYLAVAPEHRAVERARLSGDVADTRPWLGTDPPLARWAEALASVLGSSVRSEFDATGGAGLTGRERGSYGLDAPPPGTGGRGARCAH